MGANETEDGKKGRKNMIVEDIWKGKRAYKEVGGRE